MEDNKNFEAFTPEDLKLWEICVKNGKRLAERKTVTQIAIIDLYDELREYITKTLL
jgi:hypothetical protein